MGRMQLNTRWPILYQNGIRRMLIGNWSSVFSLIIF
jgi:hypothetical protein